MVLGGLTYTLLHLWGSRTWPLSVTSGFTPRVRTPRAGTPTSRCAGSARLELTLDVAVQPVDALDFEHHVIGKDVGDGAWSRHDGSCADARAGGWGKARLRRDALRGAQHGGARTDDDLAVPGPGEPEGTSADQPSRSGQRGRPSTGV
jgi:hypothetical protein